MKHSRLFLPFLLLAVCAMAAACGNAGGSSNTGSDAPGTVNILTSLSPSTATTAKNDVLVTVKVTRAGMPVPDGTTVNLAVDGGGLAEVGGDPPSDENPSRPSLTVTTTSGSASAWWTAPTKEGTYHVTVSVLGSVTTTSLQVVAE